MEEGLSKHIYKMNPPCPYWHEEHMWWHRQIPLWAEQKFQVQLLRKRIWL